MTSKNNLKEVNYLNRRKSSTHIFIWVAVFFWMMLIFNLSSQAAEQSDALSSKVIEIVIKTAEKFIPGGTIRINMAGLNHLVRKKSHFFIYLILGFLFMGAIRRSGVYGIKGVIITLLFCSLYAVLDEAHQFFVPGRGAQVKDIFIDVTGAVVGILGYLSINKKTV